MPRGLREQLATQQVGWNPGAGEKLPLTMTDSRWPASEGWVKMQQMVKAGGEPINVHYVYNTITGIVDDLKIVMAGARPQ